MWKVNIMEKSLESIHHFISGVAWRKHLTKKPKLKVSICPKLPTPFNYTEWTKETKKAGVPSYFYF
jgi:hypothetical protein